MSTNPKPLLQIVTQTMDRFARRHAPITKFEAELLGSLSVEVINERQQMEADLRTSQCQLAAMRDKEVPLRSAVVSAMAMLQYTAGLAWIKQCDAESMMIFTRALVALQDADTAWQDQRGEIHLAEIEIADAQRVLDNPEYWTPEATAQINARKAVRQ